MDTREEKILNIIPLEQYLIYNEINNVLKKDTYNGYELDNIFDEINKSYQSSNTAKKLEKK